MNHMTISEFRANLPKAFDMVRKTEEPMIVTQGSKEPVWLLPMKYWPPAENRSLPAAQSANELDRAIASAKKGKRTRVSSKNLMREASAAQRAKSGKK